MATRIYQGRVLSADYSSPEAASTGISAMDSLVYTFRLFQDAVNYHLVALAGMIDPTSPKNSTLGQFRDQVKSSPFGVALLETKPMRSHSSNP